MPTPALKALAKKAGTSLSRAEKLWDKAKEKAAEAGKAGDWAYITGIVKRMMGVEGWMFTRRMRAESSHHPTIKFSSPRHAIFAYSSIMESGITPDLDPSRPACIVFKTDAERQESLDVLHGGVYPMTNVKNLIEKVLRGANPRSLLKGVLDIRLREGRAAPVSVRDVESLVGAKSNKSKVDPDGSVWLSYDPTPMKHAPKGVHGDGGKGEIYIEANGTLIVGIVDDEDELRNFFSGRYPGERVENLADLKRLWASTHWTMTD